MDAVHGTFSGGMGRSGVAVPAPLTVRALDAVTARALGVRGDGALLARPDGVPVPVWASPAGASDLRRVMELPAIRSAHDLAVA